MTLSIVILSYNTPDMVLDCVNSLSTKFRDELMAKSLEIIVVDNASIKENLENLEKQLKDLDLISLVKSDKNLGFGGGCNLGAKKAKGEYVLFLNSDTTVSDRGFLKMAQFMSDNSDIGVMGGKLFNANGTPQPSVGKFYNLFNFFIMLFGGQRFGLLLSSPSKTSRVDWVSGACFMVKREIFEKLRGFDEQIFMYVEDMELCFRMKKAGYKTYFFPEVGVVHKEHGSSSRTFAVVGIYKGLLYFYKKHKSRMEYMIVSFFLWLKALSVYLLGRIINNNYYVSTYGQALKLFR